MFIGIKGIRNANNKELLSQYIKAVELDSNGVDFRIIKQKTNFEKGKDGGWRCEIDDVVNLPFQASDFFAHSANRILIPYIYEHKNKITFEEYLQEHVKGNDKCVLEDFEEDELEVIKYYAENGVAFPHSDMSGSFESSISEVLPKMSEYYPEFLEWKLFVKKLDDGVLGYTDKENKIVALSRNLSYFSITSTILHEFQHVIQGIEEWESGSNLYEANKILETTTKCLNLLSSKNPSYIFQSVFCEKDWVDVCNFRLAVRLMFLCNKIESIQETINDCFDYYKNLKRILDSSSNIFGIYESKLGETEARNCSTRHILGGANRKNLTFYDTSDKRYEEVFVIKKESDLLKVSSSLFNECIKNKLSLYVRTFKHENLANFLTEIGYSDRYKELIEKNIIDIDL